MTASVKYCSACGEPLVEGGCNMHGKGDNIVHDAPSPDDGVGVAVHAPENKIPWWARGDIDRWQRHLMNGSEEEAEGSWADFQLLAEKPGLLIVEAYEVDCLLLISSKEGVTFIKCYGENGCTTYVGIQADFHEVYTSHEAHGPPMKETRE